MEWWLCEYSHVCGRHGVRVKGVGSAEGHGSLINCGKLPIFRGASAVPMTNVRGLVGQDVRINRGRRAEMRWPCDTMPMRCQRILNEDRTFQLCATRSLAVRRTILRNAIVWSTEEMSGLQKAAAFSSRTNIYENSWKKRSQGPFDAL
jgi:hypothetical protein